jgi:S1-C subfamily serine protease
MLFLLCTAFGAAWYYGTWPFPSAASTEGATFEEEIHSASAPPRGQPVKGPTAAVEKSDQSGVRPPETAPAAMPSAAEPLTQLSTEEIVSRSLPAVVTVETRGGTGSGFFVSNDTVITNAHVVLSATTVTLRSSGGAASAAAVLTSSPELDLAVLKVQIVNPAQPTLPLAESEDVRIGAEVVAIGSPLGLRNTVTRGIVSGMRDSKGVSLIQTDAAINPGNSGGPLIDRYGRVIGVNTLKLAGESEAIGFAVSVNHTRTILGDAFVAPSGVATEVQRKRDFSLRKYDEAILALAKRADTIDAEWRRFKPECALGDAEVLTSREWFALADGVAFRVKPLSRCESSMPVFNDWARRTKSALELYENTAISGGVPAERLREVRQNYNMSWVGWGR